MSIVSYHDFFPNDVVRTAPQNLSERQKKQVLENIGAMSKDQQIGGGLTPEQAQKLREIDNKLDQSQLQDAINQALLQAQQSGQFDGLDGKTPKLSIGTVTTLESDQPATAIITGTVEDLKLNLGVPRGKDGGPLEPLTFTGAATGTYDGTAPLTVNIPAGGGGSGLTPFSVVYENTLTQDAAIEVPEDLSKNDIVIDLAVPAQDSIKRFNALSVIFGSSEALNGQNYAAKTYGVCLHIVAHRATGGGECAGVGVYYETTNPTPAIGSPKRKAGDPVSIIGGTPDNPIPALFRSGVAMPSGTIIRIMAR